MSEFGIVFSLGRYLGPSLRQSGFFQYWIPPKREATIQKWFQNYGDQVVFFARFAPGLRMPLYLSSGLYGVSPWKFFFLDGLAATLSVPLWIWLGSFFGSRLELLEEKIQQVHLGLYGILGGFLGLSLLLWFLKRYFKKRFSL